MSSDSDKLDLQSKVAALEEKVTELENKVLQFSFYEQLIEAVNQSVIATEPDGTIVYWNRYSEDLYGWKALEVIGRYLGETLITDCACSHGRKMIERIHDAESWSGELSVRNRNNVVFPVIFSKTPILDINGDIAGIVITSHTVSDLKETKESSIESDSLLRLLIENSETVITVQDIEGRYLYCNGSSRFGIYENDMLGMIPEEIFNENDAALIMDHLRKAASTGEMIHTESSMEWNGSAYYFKNHIVPLKNEDNTVNVIISIFENTTGRKIAEEALNIRLRYEEGLARCSKTLLEDNKETLDDALKYLKNAADIDRVYIFENYINADGEIGMRLKHEVCGLGTPSEAENPTLNFLSYKNGFIRWQEILGQNQAVRGTIEAFPEHEKNVLISRGFLSILVLPINVRGSWFGFIGFEDTKKNRSWDDEDIRLLHTAAEMIGTYIERKLSEKERKTIEVQLQQSQKMEAIGTFAGGIAHDFNNILFPIIGYTEMAIEDLAERAETRNNLQQVLMAASRAKDLVKQILTFSRMSDQEKKPLRIQPVLKEVLKLIRASLPTTIQMHSSINRNCGAILANPTEIHQVLMNLCSNAYHSMREKGGVLEVILDETRLSKKELASYPGRDPGAYLKLTVIDTGTGMSDIVKQQIFNPYFTTKESGEGTGLGLSVVHGIISEHNGFIKVETEPGSGTKFEVFLPRIETLDEAKDQQLTDTVPAGKERILLVDDEFQIVKIIHQMLETLGYKVTPRTSSVEAFEAFRSNPERFDLLITDMTMPNMTGVELSKEIMRIRPDLPIILCTGFSELITEEKAKAIGIRELVMKPVVKKELAETIRKVLQ